MSPHAPRPRPAPPGRPRSSRRGLSIVEVLIALLVLVTGLAAFTRALVGGTELGRSNRESALAMEGARSMIERLYAEDFATLFARYNATAADDPPGLAPGPGFAVPGLDLQAGDPDGLAGEIRFPTIAVGGALELREDLDDAALGMPRDLDGDGAVDAADHALDYRFLPVEVRVRWRGRAGEREVLLRTVLARR